MAYVLQEHEVLHDELNNQNKALLQRVKELVDVGDVKDTRIRELEAQVRSLQGNSYIKSYSGIALLLNNGTTYILCHLHLQGRFRRRMLTS